MSKTITIDGGNKFVLQDKWLRITQNPEAPNYPKTGDIVTIKHDYSFFLHVGEKWVIEQVEEYEPALYKDEDGRDIRITFVAHPHPLLNGVNVRKALA